MSKAATDLIERLKHPIPYTVCAGSLINHLRLQLISRVCDRVVVDGDNEHDYVPEMRSALEMAGYFLAVRITDR